MLSEPVYFTIFVIPGKALQLAMKTIVEAVRVKFEKSRIEAGFNQDTPVKTTTLLNN